MSVLQTECTLALCALRGPVRNLDLRGSAQILDLFNGLGQHCLICEVLKRSGSG